MSDDFQSNWTSMAKKLGIHKAHRNFLLHMLDLFLSIRGRINFMSLSRHTTRYQELNLRLGFARQVDFLSLNQAYCQEHGSGNFLIAFDLTYLPKSGKSTAGVGKYWSGSAQKALWGLEVGLLSVIDLDNHTAFHLDAIATPCKADREAKEIDLADHYTQAILWATPQIKQLSSYIALDAYFAKKSILDRLQTQLHVVSRLRVDADCYYLADQSLADQPLEPRRGRPRRGRPRLYRGKIDWKKPDTAFFQPVHLEGKPLEDKPLTEQVYTAVVYCKFLKQRIRVALTHCLDAQGEVKSYKIYFSTDLELAAQKILTYYKARFQQEFLIRDAKQFTGFTHCQARSVNKLEYHWNLALTAINVAKGEHYLSIPKEERGSFSMSRIKALYHNQLLIDRIFDNLPQSTQLLKNTPQIEQLYYFGACAA